MNGKVSNIFHHSYSRWCMMMRDHILGKIDFERKSSLSKSVDHSKKRSNLMVESGNHISCQFKSDLALAHEREKHQDEKRAEKHGRNKVEQKKNASAVVHRIIGRRDQYLNVDFSLSILNGSDSYKTRIYRTNFAFVMNLIMFG